MENDAAGSSAMKRKTSDPYSSHFLPEFLYKLRPLNSTVQAKYWHISPWKQPRSQPSHMLPHVYKQSASIAKTGQRRAKTKQTSAVRRGGETQEQENQNSWAVWRRCETPPQSPTAPMESNDRARPHRNWFICLLQTYLPRSMLPSAARFWFPPPPPPPPPATFPPLLLFPRFPFKLLIILNVYFVMRALRDIIKYGAAFRNRNYYFYNWQPQIQTLCLSRNFQNHFLLFNTL